MPDPVTECVDCGRDFTPDDPDAEYCPRCDDSGDDYRGDWSGGFADNH